MLAVPMTKATLLKTDILVSLRATPERTCVRARVPWFPPPARWGADSSPSTSSASPKYMSWTGGDSSFGVFKWCESEIIMMTLDSSRNLAGVGTLLMVNLPHRLWGPHRCLGAAGHHPLACRAEGMADFYKEQGIFNNALYGFILVIVGVVVAVVVAIISMVAWFATIGVNIRDLSSWSQLGPALTSYFQNPGNMGGIFTFLGQLSRCCSCSSFS